MNDPRTWPRVLAADFAFTAPKTRGGYIVTVPEGTLLKPIESEPGFYWVDQFTWCNDDPIARHDAVHYGIRVPESATRERGSVPKAASYNVATRTIRSEPENYWLATADSFDGAVAHDATARAMAAGLGFLHRLAALDAAPIVDQLEAVQALVAEARAVLDAR